MLSLWSGAAAAGRARRSAAMRRVQSGRVDRMTTGEREGGGEEGRAGCAGQMRDRMRSLGTRSSAVHSQ